MYIPEVVDGRAVGVHALVGTSHRESGAIAVVRVSEEALADASVGRRAVLQVGGTEEKAVGVRGGSVEVHAYK